MATATAAAKSEMPRPRDPARSRRSQGRTRSALLRSGLAIAALSTGYIAAAHSLASTLKGANPERAYAVSIYDGRVAATLAQYLSNSDPKRRSFSDALAVRALRQDPTAVAAVSALGLNTQIRGDTPGARRQFAYAEKLSRRDLQTQLWAIEDSVAQGDVPGALRHYDTALRTSRQASDLLFPVLAGALTEPSVRNALVHRLKRDRPSWGIHFMGFAAAQGPDPKASGELFLDLHRAGLPPPAVAQAALIDRLIGFSEMERAWQLYRRETGASDPERSRDPDFARDPAIASQFDWQFVNDADIATTGRPEGGGAVVEVSVAPGAGGTILRQMQLLPAGSYRIESVMSGTATASTAPPYWTLSCRDGRPLGRVEVPVSETPRRVAGRFDVPTDCRAQVLSLVARPTDANTGLELKIVRAQLAPVKPGERS